MEMTCKQLIGELELDNTWNSEVSVQEYINSPFVGQYKELENGNIMIVDEEGEIEITDIENINVKYPVFRV